MDTLAHIINNNIEIASDHRMQKTIEALGFYFQQHNLSLEIDLKITSFPCGICQKHIRKINQSNSFKLNCNHTCCSKKCLQDWVSNQPLTDWENTKCPACGYYIHPVLLEEAFGGREAFEKILLKYEEENSAKFTCEICFGVFRVDRGITLDCDHRFCVDCITGLIEMNIDDGNVEENVMACPSCMNPISAAIIKNLVRREKYQKYDKFLLRGFRPDNVGGPNIYYKCMGNDCEYIHVFDEDVEYFNCPSCGIKVCPKCRDQPHMGISCEENNKRKREEQEKLAKERKDQAENDEFLIAAKALGFKTCPHCKSMCEKINGCKFMKCFSPLCKGKNNFCLLCEMPITDAQHYSHYKAEGPFGEICNTMDGNKD